MDRRDFLRCFSLAAATRLAAQTPAPDQLDDLVAADRILAAHEIFDAYGHVSVRSDRNPQHYFMARSLAPALVTASDILEYDLDSNVIGAAGPALFLERFIHGEVYKARPDVKAVVHCHTPSLIPFGATDVPLRPMFGLAGFIAEGVPVFEIRKTAGMTDLLIRDAARGKALAQTLGNKPAALPPGLSVGNKPATLPPGLRVGLVAGMFGRLPTGSGAVTVSGACGVVEVGFAVAGVVAGVVTAMAADALGSVARVAALPIAVRLTDLTVAAVTGTVS